MSGKNSQREYLNLGCGRVILPCERPGHHNLVNPAIYNYPIWHNVDRHKLPGVDQAFDLFAYPWPLADNSYDGALLSHIVEHIPHEIKLNLIDTHGHWITTSPGGLSGIFRNIEGSSATFEKLAACQDGWYAFFSELYRVLTPGAMVHILAPYGWSQGAITDPSHTRLITEQTFTHSMVPDPNAPFYYETGGIHFEMRATAFNVSPLFAHIQDDQHELTRALQTRINVVYDIYVQLEAVKNGQDTS